MADPVFVETKVVHPRQLEPKGMRCRLLDCGREIKEGEIIGRVFEGTHSWCAHDDSEGCLRSTYSIVCGNCAYRPDLAEAIAETDAAEAAG